MKINLKVLIGKDILPWIFGVLIVLLAIASVKQLLKRHQINNEIKALQEKTDAMRSSNADLVKLLDYVRSSSYTEEEARLRFGLAKPGERLFVIPDKNTSGDLSLNSESNNIEIVQKSNHKKWWEFFFIKR